MNNLEIYLFKSSITIVVLYTFYWSLLRNETFHILNRLFLVLTLTGSLIVPIFSFSGIMEPDPALSKFIEPVIISGYSDTTTTVNNLSVRSILSLIYFSGAIFFMLRTLLSFIKLYYLYFHLPKVRLNEFTVVILNENRSPFSFFNILFLSENDFSDNCNDEIIAHEQAHRDGYHSLDCLILEIATILQWFNPIIWLFRRSLIAEHEYLADNSVLTKGFEKVRYQKLLFERSLGNAALVLTNNFNSSLLKKRLKMMTINKSKSYARIKYVFALPVLFAILSFVSTVDSFGQKDEICTEADVMALYKGDDIKNVRKFIAENVMYPKTAKENEVSAKVYVQFVIDKKGQLRDAHVLRSDIVENAEDEVVVVGYKKDKKSGDVSQAVKDIEDEALRVINSLDGFTPALKDGKKVSTQYTFPINFILTDKDS